MQRRATEASGELTLYGLAAVVYVALGVRFGGLVLNWVVGPTFPFLVVYVLPLWVRRLRAGGVVDAIDLRDRDSARDQERVAR
jgi:hypothetical protein